MRYLLVTAALSALQVAGTAALADEPIDASAFSRLKAQSVSVRGLSEMGPSAPLDSLPDGRVGPVGHGGPVAVGQIAASSDDDSVSAKLSWTNPWNPEDGERLGLDVWNVAVSAPAGKSGSGTLFSTNGLASDFLVKFGFTRSVFGYEEKDTLEDKLLTEAAGACEDKAKKALDSAKAEALKTCKSLILNDETARLYLSQVSQQEYLDTFNATYALMWGIDGSVGYKKFDFFDAMTGAAGNSTGTPWAVGGFASFALPQHSILLSGGLQYQRKYTEGDNGTLCPLPSPAPPVLTCVTGAIGAPSETTNLLATFEFKALVPISSPVSNIGIDAKFNYDTKSDVYSFDVPLSFIPDKDGNLVGGIELGWRSDKHDVVAGLFLSTAFSL